MQSVIQTILPNKVLINRSNTSQQQQQDENNDEKNSCKDDVQASFRTQLQKIEYALTFDVLRTGNIIASHLLLALELTEASRHLIASSTSMSVLPQEVQTNLQAHYLSNKKDTCNTTNDTQCPMDQVQHMVTQTQCGLNACCFLVWLLIINLIYLQWLHIQLRKVKGE